MKWHEKWAVLFKEGGGNAFNTGDLVWGKIGAQPKYYTIWDDQVKEKEMSGVYETVVIEYLHNADVNARIVGGVETVWAESKQQAKDKRMVEHCKGEHNPNIEVLCRPFA